jgi:hypothetical protein
VTGGLLTDALVPQAAILAAGLPVLATLSILPRWSAGPSQPRAPAPAGGAASGALAATPETLLRLAWMTNAIAFGVGGTMNMHAPKLLLARGAGASEFGLVLGSVFVVQTITFAALSRHRPGTGSLVSAHASGAIALVLFLLAPSLAARLASTLPLGFALGLAYQSSIHASLDREHGRGKAAGSHETLLGAGSSSIPLLGGALAHATGSLAAPFLLGSGLFLAGLSISAALRAGR